MFHVHLRKIIFCCIWVECSVDICYYPSGLTCCLRSKFLLSVFCLNDLSIVSGQYMVLSYKSGCSRFLKSFHSECALSLTVFCVHVYMCICMCSNFSTVFKLLLILSNTTVTSGIFSSLVASFCVFKDSFPFSSNRSYILLFA